MMQNLTAEAPAISGPLHFVTASASPIRVTFVPPLVPMSADPNNLPPPRTATTITASSIRPKLTLSAFRRPENTVRLTRSDPSRVLETEYSLRAPGCGILGHGAFSTVRLARRRRDNLRVAIKSIAKHDALRARRLRRGGRSHLDEWEILQQMEDHPYIVQLLDIFETDEEIHLVTEYCEGGELFDAIQKKRSRSPAVRRGHYSEEQAACITHQLLTALRDLHAKGICHRDVKPENIVLKNSDDDSDIHAKLCDFGMARCFVAANGGSGSDTETPPPTPGRKHSFCAVSCDYYAAPEVCAVGSSHKPSADIYSLGVTLYILLCGFPPMFSDQLSSREDEGSDVVFPDVHWSSISECARRLIRNMLHPDPAKRISAKHALQDDWILQYNKTSIKERELYPSCAVARNPASDPQHSGEDLADHIRNRLYQALSRLQEEPQSSAKRKGSDVIVSPRRKRRRGSMECHRRSSIVCAMKELYCDMASVSAAASAAAAGVVCNDEKNDVRVYNGDLGYQDSDEKEENASSPFNPHVTLSV